MAVSEGKVSLEKNGFKFGAVVSLLAEMFQVHEDRRPTFVSRLQQLQKMGLPGSSNVGKGASLLYVNWQVADLALLLDLLDCGITPGMLKDYFRPNDRNYLGVYSAGGYGLQVQNSLADGERDMFYLLRLNALGYLTRPPSPDGGGATRSPFDRKDYGRSSETVLSELGNGPALAINMTAHLRRLRTAVERTFPDEMHYITFYPTRSGLKVD